MTNASLPPPPRMTWKQLALIVLIAAVFVTAFVVVLGGSWDRYFPAR